MIGIMSRFAIPFVTKFFWPKAIPKYSAPAINAKTPKRLFLPLFDVKYASLKMLIPTNTAVERNSPMPVSKMPRGPLHPHCGERCHKELHDGGALVLTAAALALTFYDI